MKRLRRTFLFAALVAASASALALPGAARQDGDWQSKPYQQWTMKDVEKVLYDSPWAQTQQRNGQTYVLRLRSAMPVRQGMLRLRQLKEKYDQMSDKKKAEFDEKNKALMECPACADNYVVALLPQPGGQVTLPDSLTKATVEQARRWVLLANDRGEQRAAVHYAPSKSLGQEAVFFFPKFDDKGAPMLTPASKRVVFTIDPRALGNNPSVTRFEFDVSKMLVDGKVEF
jgi:hypothetical protein